MLKFLLCFTMVFLLCSAYARAEAPTAGPEKVIIGAYVNDIQELDVRTHSYRLDLYVWFRWHNPAFDPSKTAEFMNAYSPSEHVRTPFYDKPQKMPDGSLYMLIRDQGQFSVKFPLQKYPFDHQQLAVQIEDGLYGTDKLVYVPDDTKGSSPITLNPRVILPGFDTGTPALNITALPYPTNFGDISDTGPETYSRAIFSIPVSRPSFTTGIKIFLPVALIVLCTAMIFFIHPAYIEGRLGVAITALLTLVALQLTTANGLPDVDYLLLTDKIYLLSYLFILLTLLQVVRFSTKVQAGRHDEVKIKDRGASVLVCGLFLIGIAGVILF